MKPKKKLIEVALPLADINAASSREKSLRHGHPSTLHLWWARRPLAACRAVLFASIVDDPSEHKDKFPKESDQNKERQRLFSIIRQLSQWENLNNRELFASAHQEMQKYADLAAINIHDPFCGGGSIPVEAQRLGLNTVASDLNPVPVMITRAMVEYPQRFLDLERAIGPEYEGCQTFKSLKLTGLQAVVEDIKRYGRVARSYTFAEIGRYYPELEFKVDRKNHKASVIAYIWARTAECINPACKCELVLVRSFDLSQKEGTSAWVETKVNKTGGKPKIEFSVKRGKGKGKEGTAGKTGVTCLNCKTVVPLAEIRKQGKERGLGAKLMAIVVEGDRGRHYLDPTPEQESLAAVLVPEDTPDTPLPEKALGFRVQEYGMRRHRDLFTSRQLLAMTTFSNQIIKTREKIYADAVAAGLPDDDLSLEDGGRGASAYADLIAMYLAFALDKCSDFWSTIATWSPQPKNELVVNTFGRHAIPMSWNFGEVNPFSSSGGNFVGNVDMVAKAVANLPQQGGITRAGTVLQGDARDLIEDGVVISTDPPYFDNIGYADLSDYFYVWMRKSLKTFFPKIFQTTLVPKSDELIATPFRHDSPDAAEAFFLSRMTDVLRKCAKNANREIPITIFYAFKQTESNEEGEASSTGWETFLQAVVDAGLTLTGTWPMRTERIKGLKSSMNALASSIVLVCRPQNSTETISKREFISELKRTLPGAVKSLKESGIAAVDLQQALIGPGMSVFSKYKHVLESDDSHMPVRSGLVLINQVLDEVLAHADSSFDSYTRWAIAWFEQFGYSDGPFGEANTLAQAKNVAVSALTNLGIVQSKSSKVKLISPDKLEDFLESSSGQAITHWRAALHLAHTLDESGEVETARLVNAVGADAGLCRDLAYRCFSICGKNGWAQEGLIFNNLVTAWGEIQRQANEQRQAGNQEGFKI